MSSPMYVQLGESGLRVSKVIFGTMVSRPTGQRRSRADSALTTSRLGALIGKGEL